MISIITPVKNVQSWINETYQSIYSQTWTDWEWIIVDDHSTDDTLLLLKEIALKDERVIVLKNTTSGIIPALQTAFKQCTGEFITRIDGDDLMTPNLLELMQKKILQETDDCVVTGKVKYFSNGEISEGYLKYEEWLNNLVDNNNHYDHIYRECVVASPNWLMRTATASEIGLFEKINYPEDYDMCFIWMENNLAIRSISEVTLLWREHPKRTSRNSAIYQQQSFFHLKLAWFTRLHKEQSIGVLGYGSKGKIVSKYLDSELRKHIIYVEATKTLINTTTKEFKKADAINTDLLLISIYPPNLNSLEQQLAKQGYTIGKNAFYL